MATKKSSYDLALDPAGSVTNWSRRRSGSVIQDNGFTDPKAIFTDPQNWL
jgi:hypothetical protein